jgi:hypothetical protein
MANYGKAYGFSSRCLRGSQALDLPNLTTADVINITQMTATSGGNVTSEGGTSVTSRGVCWSTASNPTISDNHTTDGSGIGVFVSNLTGLIINTLYYVRAYATNSAGTVYGNEVSFTMLDWSCGDSITIHHVVSGGVAPVDKTVTYGTVTNVPGETSKCWITSNLGADHQATVVNDATEPSAGWYWQFNRMQGYKHDGTTRTPNTYWTTYIGENSDWLASNDPCVILLGIGWRLPTSTEWTNVDASGGWTDWSGPWNSALKMHVAGFLDGSSGSLYLRGSYGWYWSSSQYNSAGGQDMVLYSGACQIGWDLKSNGFTIRCLRD